MNAKIAYRKLSTSNELKQVRWLLRYHILICRFCYVFWGVQLARGIRTLWRDYSTQVLQHPLNLVCPCDRTHLFFPTQIDGQVNFTRVIDT
jgi:hypothetical protein